jgi:hypothetical protein
MSTISGSDAENGTECTASAPREEWPVSSYGELLNEAQSMLDSLDRGTPAAEVADPFDDLSAVRLALGQAELRGYERGLERAAALVDHWRFLGEQEELDKHRTALLRELAADIRRVGR